PHVYPDRPQRIRDKSYREHQPSVAEAEVEDVLRRWRRLNHGDEEQSRALVAPDSGETGTVGSDLEFSDTGVGDGAVLGKDRQARGGQGPGGDDHPVFADSG